MRVRHTPKSRFNVPSSAVSLPSIALLSTSNDNESRPRRKSDHSPEKRRALKQVKSASGLLRPNLERISGSDSSSSSDSSAENLHHPPPTSKQKPRQAKDSGDAIDKKSRPDVTSSSARIVDDKLCDLKSPSPPPAQDDDVSSDVMSDVMDSEIAKHDVAIALAEEEERCLAREIQEMEKSEMPDVDTDGDQVRVDFLFYLA